MRPWATPARDRAGRGVAGPLRRPRPSWGFSAAQGVRTGAALAAGCHADCPAGGRAVAARGERSPRGRVVDQLAAARLAACGADHQRGRRPGGRGSSLGRATLPGLHALAVAPAPAKGRLGRAVVLGKVVVVVSVPHPKAAGRGPPPGRGLRRSGRPCAHGHAGPRSHRQGCHWGGSGGCGRPGAAQARRDGRAPAVGRLTRPGDVGQSRNTNI